MPLGIGQATFPDVSKAGASFPLYCSCCTAAVQQLKLTALSSLVTCRSPLLALTVLSVLYSSTLSDQKAMIAALPERVTQLISIGGAMTKAAGNNVIATKLTGFRELLVT